MAIPTAYSEQELAIFMQSVLGPTAEAIGWAVGPDADDAGDYAEVVNDTLLVMGLSAIDSATDVAALRAVARWQAWRWAADTLASRFDTTIGGQTLARSQLHEQAVKARDAAYASAMPHMASYGVTATQIIHTDDPIDAPIRRRVTRGW